MTYRLGLDLGTNSIGWAAFAINPAQEGLDQYSLMDMGVRIFSDGRQPSSATKIGDSLSVDRRLARGMRRNRDHGKNRVRHMITQLVTLGLMPENKQDRQALQLLNPYQLRAEALIRPLAPHELGRALFHLGRRRGFKSNRKQSQQDSETDFKNKITALRQKLGNQTLGQFLWDRCQSGNIVRFREDNQLFPDRDMYETEFMAIMEAQTPHHNLTEEQWLRLRDHSILFQHPLRPAERGKCSLRPDYERAYRDSPTAQWFRLYQDVTNLRWIDDSQTAHALTSQQQDLVMQDLTRLHLGKSGKPVPELTWSKMRALTYPDGTLLFPRNSRFNLETENRKGIQRHKIALWCQHSPHLQDLWSAKDWRQGLNILEDIFDRLQQAETDDRLIADLVRHHKLSEHQAKALAGLPIGSQTVNLSREVMQELIPLMADQGLGYAAAVAELTDKDGNSLHHSYFQLDQSYDRLPYYGEILQNSLLGAKPEKNAKKDPEGHYGRIGNPSVHMALNQLRHLINALIERLGKPAAIHIELSRDLKLTAKQRSEVNREIAKNTRRNKNLTAKWLEICSNPPSATDLKKLKLWEELDPDEIQRRCVFTGRKIGAAQLINGEVHIEHLLPYSRTLDNSMANLTLAFKDANQIKSKHSPYEAFGAKSEPGFNWEEILQRAQNLPKSKRWRFGPDAMHKWLGDHDFIDRQLTDNAYIARAARKYLTAICPDIIPSNGRQTAMIRGKWRLFLSDQDDKNREDHRHHCLDACVIALMDRSLLHKISNLSKRDCQTRLKISLPDLPDRLRQSITARAENLVISHKPDHGLQGKFHKDTAYGRLNQENPNPGEEDYNLVVRKPIANLSLNELDAIRDPGIRAALAAFLTYQGFWSFDKKEQEKKLPDLLSQFGQDHQIRRLRIMIKDKSAIPIPSAPYKAYTADSYVCCDIWALPDGKPGKWKKGKFKYEGVFWSYMETSAYLIPKDASNVDHRQAPSPPPADRKPHPAAKFITRLFKGDLIRYYKEDKEIIMRVTGLEPSSTRVTLRPPYLPNCQLTKMSLNKLGQYNVQKIFITPDGVIKNQGPKK